MPQSWLILLVVNKIVQYMRQLIGVFVHAQNQLEFFHIYFGLLDQHQHQ
jgi:hypothetical protein